MLRKQSSDTNQNIKRLVDCRYRHKCLSFIFITHKQSNNIPCGPSSISNILTKPSRAIFSIWQLGKVFAPRLSSRVSVSVRQWLEKQSVKITLVPYSCLKADQYTFYSNLFFSQTSTYVPITVWKHEKCL